MPILELLKKIVHMCSRNFKGKGLGIKAKIIITIGVAFLIKFYLRSQKVVTHVTSMSISQFLSPLNKAILDKVNIYPSTIVGKDKFGNIIKAQHSGMPSKILYEQLKGSNVNFSYIGNYVDNSKLDALLLLSSIVSAVIVYFLYKKNTESKKPTKPVHKIMFNDIIGLESAKLALKEVLQYMMNPQKYQQRGARMRRGVLLYGPPGTGKTTLAKACANEAGIPFYSCNAAQFCQIYVGMGPKKVRDLFAKARETSPCVIFIDQLDAFGSRTGENSLMFESASSEKNSTINQILSQIDGFETSDKVLVIAATNRLEMVDKSLVRSGRFDVKIGVPLPSLQTKKKILQRYLSRTKSALSEVFVQKLLERSQFSSGADIQALVNQAIYHSMRRDSMRVQEQDILSVLKQSHN